MPSPLLPSSPPQNFPPPLLLRIPPPPAAIMKDRSGLYVPPHQRLPSAISANSPAPLPPSFSKPLSPFLPSRSTQPPKNERNYPQYNVDRLLGDGAGHGFDMKLATDGSASNNDNIENWKRKLTMLSRNKNEQEVISREKKDRRDFEQIAALANQIGLYSQLYSKAAVFSKVPLPNYRYDLDDKRPQREVSLPLDLLRKVKDHLNEYNTLKTKLKEDYPDCSFSRCISSSSIASEESLFEQFEPLPTSKLAMEKALGRRNLQLREQQHLWQDSLPGRKILEFRRGLPAYKERDLILTAISQNQVVIISGETGCGKTTQIPQYILESEIDSGRGACCNIICTQPRRISAISISERVASERGEDLGETVGYKVRLEGKKGRGTRLLFCTTGILLRRLLVDRNLKGITHVIVDEIHERGMNEDFLLIVLKDLLPRRGDLRLILMSATLDAELFSSYFGGAPVFHIPGFTYPVHTYFLEDILEMTGYKLTPSNQIDDYGLDKIWKMNKQASRKMKSPLASVVEGVIEAANLRSYSPETRASLSCWNPECMGFNLIEYLLTNICKDDRPGAVLVFMTGWDDISSLKEKLQAHPILGDPSRVLLLACHGSMASSEQRLIFEQPAKGVRKVILATNIAETSITINDVVFVIDCGKAKETSYDALNKTPCLLPSWISRVSAQQRRGRAGRVQTGECYHLYPKCVFDALVEYQLPEILRTPLQSICLQIKSLKLGSISGFLSRALQSPESLAVENAIEYLKLIGALDEDENLTVLGRYLATLPVEPKLGKMLILGCVLNYVDPMLTIVAGLTVRDPFLAPIDKKDLADAAKERFARDFSDHIALLRAYEGWKNAEVNFAGYDYCWKNFLSLQSMKEMDILRKDLLSLLRDSGLLDGQKASNNSWNHNEDVIRAIICYGLYPNICSVVPSEKSFSLKTMEDGQVLLHSSSANARKSQIPHPWLVFSQKIKVNSIFLRDSTALSDSMVLLFGGSISHGDMEGHLKMLGGYLDFFMNPAVADMFCTIKQELDRLILTKLLNPRIDVFTYHRPLLSAVSMLLAVDVGSGRFIFGHKYSMLSKSVVPTVQAQSASIRHTESCNGGNNSKNQLQTLITRAGHPSPIYKTQQLKNGQFQTTVEFNGMEVTGQPYNNKKSAEKDAAAVALQWLLGGTQPDVDYVNQMSILLKKRRKDHH